TPNGHTIDSDRNHRYPSSSNIYHSAKGGGRIHSIEICAFFRIEYGHGMPWYISAALWAKVQGQRMCRSFDFLLVIPPNMRRSL
ncbi:hypothetical protein, partial [Candidatus Igneacidithiobacillus taiwanensis]|uniref:hypothetical protein n=1 Tax=Candidatus Igneacidithiobacillus taiwanensis TaxID=1945924 RepID=UPI00289F35DF